MRKIVLVSNLASKRAKAFSKLDNKSRDNAILGMLGVIKDDSCFNSHDKLRTRIIYHYQLDWNSTICCKKAFCAVVGIGKEALKRLQKQVVSDSDVTPSEHGNCRKANSKALTAHDKHLNLMCPVTHLSRQRLLFLLQSV